MLLQSRATGYRFRSASTFGIVSAGLLTLTGCSADTLTDEDLASIDNSLVVNTTGDPGAYLTSCWDNFVPKPPDWGKDNVGPAKNWFYRGSLPIEEGFLNFSAIEVYMSSAPAKDGSLGVCVIGAHNENGNLGSFDVICQGANGKACFWEGQQSASLEAPTPLTVSVLGAGWTTGGTPVVPEVITTCTRCHTGQNAFITHFAPPNMDGSPGNPLAPPTSSEIAARPGLAAWMPAQYGSYDPLGSDPTAKFLGGTVPAKDTFSGYPASTSHCTACHSGLPGSGGGFPLASTPQLRLDPTFCSILWSVTNRPASLGGMPPTWADGSPNTCTPPLGVGVPDCAAQRDPFVQTLLAACNREVTTDGLPATLAFARDIATSTPFVFTKSVSGIPGSGVYLVATSQPLEQKGVRAKWVYKFRNDVDDDGWNPVPSEFPVESSTSNFFTVERPAGYLKSGSSRSFVVKSYANSSDGFGQIGDVYELDTDASQQVRNVTKGVVVPRGQPAPIYRPADGVNSIYVSDPNGWLHQFDWNPSTLQWYGGWTLQGPQVHAATSSPMAYTGLGNSIVVLYACGARSGCELRWSFSAGAWIEVVGTPPVSMVAGTRPTGILYNGSQFMFSNTTSGLYVSSDSTGGGYTTWTRIASTSRFFGSPTPYVRADGKLEVLINYLDSLGNQTLYAYTRLSSGSWLGAQLFDYTANGVAPVIGEPMGYAKSILNNTNGALFVDANRNVRNIQQRIANTVYEWEPSHGHNAGTVLIGKDSWKKYQF